MATRAKAKRRAKAKGRTRSQGSTAARRSSTKRASAKRSASAKRGASVKRRAAPKSRASTKRSTTSSKRAAAKRKTQGRSSTGRSSRATSRSQRTDPAQARAARELSEQAAEQEMPADAIALLEHDHREVEQLLEEFEQAEGREKAELARKICVALTVHATIEEELFYPRARKAIDEEELIDEAMVEHETAKQLIAEIASMGARDKLFDARVKVLGEYVKHHVKEEENEIFPKAREGGLDLEGIGRQLGERKLELLSELAGQASRQGRGRRGRQQGSPEAYQPARG